MKQFDIAGISILLLFLALFLIIMFRASGCVTGQAQINQGSQIATS